MIPLLAQSLPPATDLAAFFGVAAFLLVIYNQAKAAFGVSPPLHKTYATKEDLHQAHGRMSRERDDANAKIAAVAAENKELRAKLDGDIGELREQLAQNNKDGESRVEGLRKALSEQTTLIISVIRGGGK